MCGEIEREKELRVVGTKGEKGSKHRELEMIWIKQRTGENSLALNRSVLKQKKKKRATHQTK